jgi:hypothetical protein
MSDIHLMPAELLIPHYLIHSCIYYEELGQPLITDSDYDAIARRIYVEWDSLAHMHKHLIEREALLTSGYYLQYTNMIRSAAKWRLANCGKKSYLADSELMEAKKKINARSKGQRGEREIIDLLQPHLNEVSSYNQVPPPFLQRNQMQSHQGGYDIVGLPGFAFEVKRVEKDQDGAIAGWWRQCCGQAKAGEEPVLFYRRNGQAWRVMLFTRLDLDAKRRYKIPSVISMPDFIFYLKARVHCLQLEQKKVVDG